MSIATDAWTAYRLRWKRRRLLWRAFRKRRELTPIEDRTDSISSGDVLGFLTVRNEALRLPFFLAHHRRLGVKHFLIVDNGSRDETATYLAGQPDVSLWSSPNSYKSARFGMDWLGYLLMRYGHGHWCLTLDADEILIYPYWPERPLQSLTDWLDSKSLAAFGALMLDLYPKGPTDQTRYQKGDDPAGRLQWFDAAGYTRRRQEPLRNLWQQGGARARMFFKKRPHLAPTLNKLPLVKWNRRYVFVNSTHALLPRRLNLLYDGVPSQQISGVLLHTKFLNTIGARSKEERRRKQHFRNSALYNAYYDALIGNPDLWYEDSVRYTGWRQLVDLSLMSPGDWKG